MHDQSSPIPARMTPLSLFNRIKSIQQHQCNSSEYRMTLLCRFFIKNQNTYQRIGFSSWNLLTHFPNHKLVKTVTVLGYIITFDLNQHKFLCYFFFFMILHYIILHSFILNKHDQSHNLTTDCGSNNKNSLLFPSFLKKYHNSTTELESFRWIGTRIDSFP